MIWSCHSEHIHFVQCKLREESNSPEGFFAEFTLNEVNVLRMTLLTLIGNTHYA
jgi:hypothetical protein